MRLSVKISAAQWSWIDEIVQHTRAAAGKRVKDFLVHGTIRQLGTLPEIA